MGTARTAENRGQPHPVRDQHRHTGGAGERRARRGRCQNHEHPGVRSPAAVARDGRRGCAADRRVPTAGRLRRSGHPAIGRERPTAPRGGEPHQGRSRRVGEPPDPGTCRRGGARRPQWVPSPTPRSSSVWWASTRWWARSSEPDRAALLDLETVGQSTVRVLVGGEPIEVAAELVVVGDVVELDAGDNVPGDCRLIDALALEVDESTLTGESLPVAKRPSRRLARRWPTVRSMLYEGTASRPARRSRSSSRPGSRPRPAAVAAAATEPPPCGVEQRLPALTELTVPVALGAGARWDRLGLLVPAADPRGGRRRRSASRSRRCPRACRCWPRPRSWPRRAGSQRGALVRNPRAIEALGRVDVLCFDKTGTLTEGTVSLAACPDGASTQAARQRSTTPARTCSPPRCGPRPLERTATARCPTPPTGRSSRGAPRPEPRRRDRLGARSTSCRSSRAAATTPCSAATTGTRSVASRAHPRSCCPVPRRGSTTASEHAARRRGAEPARRRRSNGWAGAGYRVLAVAERAGARGRLARRSDDIRPLDVPGLRRARRPGPADRGRRGRDAARPACTSS